MIGISLCMIVKNEEDVLARCLESADGIADEVIIVDTGSTDKTREIASDHDCQVYDFDWIDNFSAARNFAFSKARMSHCMWLDADDVILPQDRASLMLLKQSIAEDTDVVMLPYHTAFDESGNPTFTYYRERIVRNSPTLRWQGAVHEAISLHGKIIYADAAITHAKTAQRDPARNLRIFRRLISEGIKLSPRDKFYYGRELYYNKEYVDAQTVLTELIQSGQGWIENRIDAYRTLALCHVAQNRKDDALHTLFASFCETLPRGEICCDIGERFMDMNNLPCAIYWYKTAMSLSSDPQSGGFVSKDCYDYIPYLQLCVCYDRMGDLKTAQYYNDEAGKIKPYSKAYLHNKEYFSQIKA